jgi:hypothetical protein
MSPVNSWIWNWSLGKGVGGVGELCSSCADTSSLLLAAAFRVQTPWVNYPGHVEFTHLDCLCPGLMAALPFVLLAEPPLWLIRSGLWNWRYKLEQQVCTNCIAICWRSLTTKSDHQLRFKTKEINKLITHIHLLLTYFHMYCRLSILQDLFMKYMGSKDKRRNSKSVKQKCIRK